MADEFVTVLVAIFRFIWFFISLFLQLIGEMIKLSIDLVRGRK